MAEPIRPFRLIMAIYFFFSFFGVVRLSSQGFTYTHSCGGKKNGAIVLSLYDQKGGL